jgi:hypothetical protein
MEKSLKKLEMYIEYELMAPDIDDVKKQLIDRGINR